MPEKTLSRSERRRIESLQKLSVKQQADNLLYLLPKFPLKQGIDNTAEFTKEALDFATPEAIMAFVNVPAIQERLNLKKDAKANQKTGRGSQQDSNDDRRSNRKTDR